MKGLGQGGNEMILMWVIAGKRSKKGGKNFLFVAGGSTRGRKKRGEKRWTRGKKELGQGNP